MQRQARHHGAFLELRKEHNYRQRFKVLHVIDEETFEAAEKDPASTFGIRQPVIITLHLDWFATQGDSKHQRQHYEDWLRQLDTSKR